MTRKQTIWALISLFSFFCISTNQPFIFLDDATLIYSVSMILGVVLTSSSQPTAPSQPQDA